MKGAGMLAIWRSPVSESGVPAPSDVAVLRAAKLDRVVCLLEEQELSWSEETYWLRRISMEALGLRRLEWEVLVVADVYL